MQLINQFFHASINPSMFHISINPCTYPWLYTYIDPLIYCNQSILSCINKTIILRTYPCHCPVAIRTCTSIPLKAINLSFHVSINKSTHVRTRGYTYIDPLECNQSILSDPLVRLSLYMSINFELYISSKHRPRFPLFIYVLFNHLDS